MATTIKIPANAAYGIHATNFPSKSKTSSALIPTKNPDIFVFPPLERLTSVGPMVPEPGIPQSSAEPIFPIPCPTNSLFELWRDIVSASSTTHVFNVSIESKTDKVKTGAIKMDAL